MLILASTSPTRQLMLRNAGLAFTGVSPGIDERALVRENPQWTPDEIALQLAAAKAADVSARHTEALAIGADQVLALGQTVYSKPRDRAECRRQLQDLRGRKHSLVSAVCCARSGAVVWSAKATAVMGMRNVSDAFIEDYLDVVGADCTSSVGGYKIEGLGIQLFDQIDGDHFTILGLPLLPLLAYLREAGEIAS